MKKNILICFDRDGTLDFDKKYHLGRQRNWKSKIRLLPNVVKSLKKLKKELPEAKIYMITNQPGVAIKNFPLLTDKRVNEVCEYVMKRLKENGVELDGYDVCGRANSKYMKRHPEFKFDKKFVGNFPCIKPKPGMIYSILKKLKWQKKNTKIYVIGDRYTDIKTAINAKGFGVLVPFLGEPGQVELIKEKIKEKKKYYLAKNFKDAINFLIKKDK